MTDLIKGALIVAFGATEGYAFFRTGIAAPSTLSDQMSFASMLVMKLFMSGVGSSMIAQGIMNMVSPKQFAASRVMSKTNAGYARALGGCFALGIGMAMAGSGPTILPAQLFAKSGNILYVLAGALSAGVLFSLVEKKLFRVDVCAKPTDKLTLDAKLGIPYHQLALPVGAALMAAVVGLEQVWPHSKDVARLGTNLSNPWNPILAGAIIGFNQLPLRYLASRGQGGSTSFMNILSTVTGGTVAERFSLSSLNASAQFLYVWIGTSIGSALALYQQSSTYTPAIGPDPVRAFLGGMLMLGGARIASGCTCGHGISGSSELSVQSLAAAAAIFSGGMFAALFLPAFGK